MKQQSRLKDLIAKGKEQGYLTYSEVNDHLPENISDPVRIYMREMGTVELLTRERIRQIEAKALRKLRHPTRSDYLRGFLDE